MVSIPFFLSITNSIIIFIHSGIFRGFFYISKNEAYR